MDNASRPSKRVRKSCERCRKRKQRCSGFPVCSNCLASKEECKQPASAIEEYRSGPNQALLDKIEFLEAQLAIYNEALDSNGSSSGHDYDASLNTPFSAVSSRHDIQRDSIADVAGLLSLGGERSYFDDCSGLGTALRFNRARAYFTRLQDPLLKINSQVGHTTSYPKAMSIARKDHTSLPDHQMGQRMLDAYFKKTHHRYPFLDRSKILLQHDQRFSQHISTTLIQHHVKFKLYMIYAIGATLLKLTETYDYTNPESFFMTALQYLSAAHEHNAVAAIEATALLVIYNLRSPSNSGIFCMIGAGMRSCVDLGLHREAHYSTLPPYTAQLRRRLFWSIYFLERVIAVSLDRPYSIADRDIDAKLPLEIDDEIHDDATITNLETHYNSSDYRKRSHQTSNLTFAIQCIRLMRIESYIQTTIYRVDVTAASLLNKLPTVIKKLEDFKETIPLLTPYETDSLNQMYWKNVRLAIQPFLNILPQHDPAVAMCLEASGQVCQIFKRRHQRDLHRPSFVALHSVFIAGITMCYCLFLSPSMWDCRVAENLRTCSSALSVVAERTPSTTKYRNALESVISSTMECISRLPNGEESKKSKTQFRESNTHPRKRSRRVSVKEVSPNSVDRAITMDVNQNWDLLFNGMSAAAPWQRELFIADPVPFSALDQSTVGENVSQIWSSSGVFNPIFGSMNFDNEDSSMYDSSLFAHSSASYATKKSAVSADQEVNEGDAKHTTNQNHNTDRELPPLQEEHPDYLMANNMNFDMPPMNAEWVASLCENDAFPPRTLNEMMKVDVRDSAYSDIFDF